MRLAFFIETVFMNKKILGTALLLGIGVAYCIHLLMGNNKPAKMNAPAKY